MAATFTNTTAGLNVSGTLAANALLPVPGTSIAVEAGKVVARTPSGMAYIFEPLTDLGNADPEAARTVLLNALNGTSMHLLTFSLTQTGTSAPTLTEGYNPSALTLTPTRTNIGRYRVTGPTGCFPAGTTAVIALPFQDEGENYTNYTHCTISGGNVLEISTFWCFNTATNFLDGILNNTAVHVIIP